MKLCQKCRKPIELALLENNSETTVCGRCRGLDVNEFYDIIKKELQSCDLPAQDKKRLEQRLLERTREISDHYRESLKSHEEHIERAITTQLQVEANKLADQKKSFEEEKNSLLDVRNKLLSEQEELAGKNHELVQERSFLEQKLEFLTKELNTCVLSRHVSELEDDQILLYINTERKTERSPLVIGKAIVRNNSYDVVIWANIDKKGQRYWSGYLNDVNGYLDGKENNRRVWFKKSEDRSELWGAITFGNVDRPIKLFAQRYSGTNLIYWKGQVLEHESIEDFLQQLNND